MGANEARRAGDQHRHAVGAAGEGGVADLILPCGAVEGGGEEEVVGGEGVEEEEEDEGCLKEFEAVESAEVAVVTHQLYGFAGVR